MHRFLMSLGVLLCPAVVALPCPRAFRGELKKVITLDEGMGFFLKIAPGSREASFVDASYSHVGQVLDLDTGKVRKISADLDPVLSPDGKVLTIPQQVWIDPASGQVVPHAQDRPADFPDYYLRANTLYDRDNKATTLSLEDARRAKKTVGVGNALAFYSHANKQMGSVAYVDRDMHGGYQSMGVLRQGSEGPTYRVMMWDDGLQIRDYRLDEASHKVAPVGDRRRICADLGDIALPALSKNGRELSYYAFKARETRVVSIDDRGQCHQTDVIPAAVGKPDFSPDGRRMAFHMDQAAGSLEIATPQRDQKLGAFLYERETKSLSLIEDVPNAHSYYPTFISNDELAYVTSPIDHENRQMAVHVVKAIENPSTSCRGCAESPARRASSAVLGALWARQCKMKDLDFSNYLLGLAGMSREQCRELLRSASDEDIGAVRSRLSTPRASDDELAELVRAARSVGRPELSDICTRLELKTPGSSPAESAR